MNRLLASALLAAALATPAIAADMTAQRVSALAPPVDALASELGHYRAVAIACRPTDGTILSREFWASRLTIVPTRQKTSFANAVKARSAPEIEAMSGPDRALRCDDALDQVEDRFPSVAEAGAGATPLCWSDVTDTNRCEGTGDDDILAGVPALLNGY
jgi:hypothetical protein